MSGRAIPIRCILWLPKTGTPEAIEQIRTWAARQGYRFAAESELRPLSSAPVNPAEECGPFRRDLALVSGKEPADGTPFPSRLQN